jgi:predicted secreted protein
MNWAMLYWSDCAIGTGQDHPSDPHVMRDFLRSCVLTPVSVALVF